MPTEQSNPSKPQIDLEAIVLAKGSHNSPKEGMCVMEMTSLLAREKFTDEPKCVSKPIRDFLVAWNDALPDDQRQMLKSYAKKVIGTKASPEIEERRGWMARDWFIRVHTPAWLELAGFDEAAKVVRALPDIVDETSADRAAKALEPIQEKAYAAGSAAWNAARSAAWSAAWSAARSAAWNAARSAAWSAAWNAARSAAWSAAWNAARSAAWNAARSAAWNAARSAAGSAAWNAAEAKLAPVTKELQRSACELLDKMIALSEAA